MRTMTAALPAIVLLLSATAVAAQDAAWPAASAAAVRLDPAPLSALEQRIRDGGFGHVDRMVVIRDSKLVVDARFPNDYREISRGRSSPIGCGIDACAAPSDGIRIRNPR